jgi:Glutathione S-transferase, C-terminal domain
MIAFGRCSEMRSCGPIPTSRPSLWRGRGNTTSGVTTSRASDAYARGIADLQVLANLLPASGFLFGAKPSSIDAAIYGFTANIYFYEIDTPLKRIFSFLSGTSSFIANCFTLHWKAEA